MGSLCSAHGRSIPYIDGMAKSTGSKTVNSKSSKDQTMDGKSGRSESVPSKSAKPKSKAASGKARVISSKLAYRGPVFSVTTDEVEEPGGVRARRDVIRHSGSIVILAVDRPASGEPRILLEHQYRHAAQSMMWELPAGRIDEGENALAAGKRELIEETGYRAKKWKQILFFYVSPGFLDETMTIYLAEDLTLGQAEPEADERIESKFFGLKAAKKMALDGTIRDAKTISGIFWLAENSRAAKG